MAVRRRAARSARTVERGSAKGSLGETGCILGWAEVAETSDEGEMSSERERERRAEADPGSATTERRLVDDEVRAPTTNARTLRRGPADVSHFLTTSLKLSGLPGPAPLQGEGGEPQDEEEARRAPPRNRHCASSSRAPLARPAPTRRPLRSLPR